MNDLALTNQDYKKELETNPTYSLEIDPEKKYKLSAKQKEFVSLYLSSKDPATICKALNMNDYEYYTTLTSYGVRNEIERITMAVHQRKFLTGMFSIDQIGEYLSGLLLDSGVPIMKPLSNSQKLKAVELLINLNRLKLDVLTQSTNAETTIEADLKDLSVQTIEMLLSNSSSQKLTDTEKQVLEEVSTSDLLNMIGDITNQEKGELY